MAELFAALVPGYLKSVQETARLVFTAPSKVDDVVISMFVTSQWNPGGSATKGGQDSLRSKIFGHIVDKKFVFESNTTTYDLFLSKDGHVTSWGWVLHVDIDGHDCHVPLPRLHTDEMHGHYQVTFQITASGALEYWSKTPLVCRAAYEPRATLAFLTGTPDDLPDPETKQFFPQAGEAWRTLADNDPARGPKSLRGILQFVSDPKKRKKRNDLPIGEVKHRRPRQWRRMVNPRRRGFTRRGPHHKGRCFAFASGHHADWRSDRRKDAPEAAHSGS